MGALSRRDFLLGAAALAVAPTVIGKVAAVIPEPPRFNDDFQRADAALGSQWVCGGASNVTLQVGDGPSYTLTDAEMELLRAGKNVPLRIVGMNVHLRSNEPYTFSVRSV